MKTKIAFLCILLFAAFSCKEDEVNTDKVYEFVSFKGTTDVNLNEKTNSTTAHQVVAQLWAHQPYNEDIEIELEVTGTNTQQNVDFMIEPSTITIKAGKFQSEPISIKTVDNNIGSADERTFVVKLKSASKAGINVGLGLTEQKSVAMTFTIVDDECSANITIFDSPLNNTINWGGDDVLKNATAELVDNKLTVSGNLIDYGPFSSAKLEMTLTPSAEGATSGSVTFPEYLAGTDDDGYEYKFVQKGTGTYDVCAGTVSVEYDIYYLDGGTWAFWYTVKNMFSIISCTNTASIFNTSLKNAVDWGEGDIMKTATGQVSGNVLTVKGDLIDYGAFSNATLSITLTPYMVGGTKGKATFEEQETGEDSDGYKYKFKQIGEGSYDVCSGKLTVEYQIYWLSGDTWTYWYDVKNVFSIE